MIRAALILLCLAAPARAEAPLPFDLGGSFTLTDQTGTPRSEADPEGRAQLLFFGYANCLQICSAALPLMADLVDDLAGEFALRPVMITVDPARDTVEEIGPPLEYLHPDFVGLTGTKAELQVAYDAYSVEIKHIFDDPEYGPIYAHGSFIYLLDGQGAVLSLLPPILSPEQAAEILRARLAPAG
ncbi:SCO family protein [Oceaniglobus trochenteri]|uniref:SCO family protein n=1 Tax=Oceaniglobus trochenteri TaxID=2763260 RepID=UPI001CFF9D0F|nr:SCO family protein [Oceaniglobus trochenteri]